MLKKFLKRYLLVLFLLILYGIITALAAIYPEEFAFVFCSTVYPQYIELCLRAYLLSEQFRPMWPWQH